MMVFKETGGQVESLMVSGSLVLGGLLHCVDPASTIILDVNLDTLGEPMVTGCLKKFDLG